MVDEDEDTARASILHLQPLGLICGGGPLRETWIDLRVRNQVFYGLNGAGKSTILNALESALSGIASSDGGPGGQLIVELPVGDEHYELLVNSVSDRISEMLTGDSNQIADVAYRDFLRTQTPAVTAFFESQKSHYDDWEPLDDLSWDGFIEALAHSKHWVFRPVGTDSPRWEASPVLLMDPEVSEWPEHAAALRALDADDYASSMPSDYGLDLLWRDERPPNGAPQGVVSTTIMATTTAAKSYPWWPFGLLVTDSLDDPARLTRDHLLNHPTDRFGYRDDELTRNDALIARAKDIEERANALLPTLLADAPALRLAVGDDRAWFEGASCTWTATRFHDDQALPLSRLSSAEQRWANVVIRGAISQELESIYEMQDVNSSMWLVIDEPERGLHRAAESHMAQGLRELARRGVRTVAATHSPELLDHGPAEVNYVRRRTYEQPGAVIGLAQFEGVRTDLGLNPSDMLGRTRGILLVEGEHDLEVLRGAVGGELDRLGVTALATRGGARLKTVVDSQFLYQFTDAVIFPLLDDLALNPTAHIWESAKAAARTRPLSDVIDHLTEQLRGLKGKGSDYLTEFLAASLKNGTFQRIQPLGIPQTDVLLCLPVKALVPTATSWESVRDELRRSSGKADPSETEFKRYLAKRHRADLSTENIRRIASTSSVHPDIKALIAKISASVESA